MAKKFKCKGCKFNVFTPTLGDPEPNWHCRCGFTPDKSCFFRCERNDACIRGDWEAEAYWCKKWFDAEESGENS